MEFNSEASKFQFCLANYPENSLRIIRPNMLACTLRPSSRCVKIQGTFDNDSFNEKHFHFHPSTDSIVRHGKGDEKSQVIQFPAVMFLSFFFFFKPSTGGKPLLIINTRSMETGMESWSNGNCQTYPQGFRYDAYFYSLSLFPAGLGWVAAEFIVQFSRPMVASSLWVGWFHDRLQQVRLEGYSCIDDLTFQAVWGTRNLSKFDGFNPSSQQIMQ